MQTYNGFTDLAANSGAVDPQLLSQMAMFTRRAVTTQNRPHKSFADGNGGVDFCTEFYARDGIVPDKAKQNEIALAVEQKPFYGVIPSGFSGFGNRKGEIIVCDDNGLRICDKSDVQGLSGYFRLPNGWEKVVTILEV